jgi:hypothetical protein
VTSGHASAITTSASPRERAWRQPHLNRRILGEDHFAPLAQHVRVDGTCGAADAERDPGGSSDLTDGRPEQSDPKEPADAAAARAGSCRLDRSVAVRIGEVVAVAFQRRVQAQE